MVERNGNLERHEILLGAHPNNPEIGYVGIASQTAYDIQTRKAGVVESASATFNEFWMMGKGSVIGIGQVFSPNGIISLFDNVSSDRQSETQVTSALNAPALEDDDSRVISIVGAINLGADLSESNYSYLLIFLALINVFIGIFNMIPLLPFDGGHVMVATYERIRSRKGKRYVADIQKMMPLTYAVILVLLFVGGSAMYLDIVEPVQLPR